MLAAMAQLIVRKLDEAVVEALRARAQRHGVSTEEEHRLILRDAVFGSRRRGGIKEHLARMPDVGDDSVFERPPASPRNVDL